MLSKLLPTSFKGLSCYYTAFLRVLFLSFVASQTLLTVTKLMLFNEGKVDIFLSGPKNPVEEVCKRTLRILIPECDQSNAPLEPPQTMAFKTNTATLYHY